MTINGVSYGEPIPGDANYIEVKRSYIFGMDDIIELI